MEYHKITVNKDKLVKKKNRKIKQKSNSSKIFKGQKKKRKVERNEDSQRNLIHLSFVNQEIGSMF